MTRTVAFALWVFGATANMAVSVAYPVEPAPAALAVNFDDLHSQAGAAIARLELAQTQHLALRADTRSAF